MMVRNMGRTVYRVLVASKMDEIRDYLINTYDYDPGVYQGYNVKVPSYKFWRVDWNINENNKVNVRFSKTNNRYDASPSSSSVN